MHRGVAEMDQSNRTVLGAQSAAPWDSSRATDRAARTRALTVESAAYVQARTSISHAGAGVEDDSGQLTPSDPLARAANAH